MPRTKLTKEEKKLARQEWLKNNKNRYECKICKFGSCNKGNLLAHYKRAKHIKNVKKLKN